MFDVKALLGWEQAKRPSRVGSRQGDVDPVEVGELEIAPVEAALVLSASLGCGIRWGAVRGSVCRGRY